MGKKNYITPHGMQKLLSEQEHLLKVERPEVTETVKWAASLGDRSENADYKYGKKKLREIDKRLRFLASRIEDAVVVDPESQDTERIQFGATVTIEDEDGEQRKYSIVGIDESDPKRGLVSWISPIGKNLLGKEEGDEVEINSPKGTVIFEIIKIEYSKINFKLDK
jgi:transcription elongation factor GreB